MYVLPRSACRRALCFFVCPFFLACFHFGSRSEGQPSHLVSFVLYGEMEEEEEVETYKSQHKATMFCDLFSFGTKKNCNKKFVSKGIAAATRTKNLGRPFRRSLSKQIYCMCTKKKPTQRTETKRRICSRIKRRRWRLLQHFFLPSKLSCCCCYKCNNDDDDHVWGYDWHVYVSFLPGLSVHSIGGMSAARNNNFIMPHNSFVDKQDIWTTTRYKMKTFLLSQLRFRPFIMIINSLVPILTKFQV